MKYIIAIIFFLSMLFSQDQIEGRWHLVGYEDNVMYQFENNYRYSIYSTDGNFGSIEDAGSTPNPYSVVEDIITIDLFFGNIVNYQMNYSCNGQVVTFIEEGFIHSILFREGYNYIDDNCEEYLEDCEDIEYSYDQLHSGFYSECEFNVDCIAVWGDCDVGLGGCHYAVNDERYDEVQIDTLVNTWIGNECSSGVCDCVGLPNVQCINGSCESAYCYDENPEGCFNSGCPDGYECIDDPNYCVPSSCFCSGDFYGEWYCTEDCNGGTCIEIESQDCLGGELRTIDSFLYGRFEVNMKSAAGDGYVSSFFTYHDHWGNSNPDEWSLLTNEIDIEMTGNQDSSIQFTTHHPGTPNSWSYSEIIDVGFNPHSEFHDYAIEWTPTSIKWFIDDIEVYSQNQNIVDDLIYSQKIMMNLWSAIWEDWVGIWDPNTMPVMAYYNYVKYYEYAPDNGNYGSNNNFILSWVDEFDLFDDSRWEEASHTFNSNNCEFDPINVLFHNGQMILIISNTEYILGDANYDSVIDILDIILIVEIVISDGGIINTADYNQDNRINVADIVQIVSLILDN